MSIRPFRGFHLHALSILTDLLQVLAPFAVLAAIAVALSYFAPWS